MSKNIEINMMNTDNEYEVIYPKSVSNQIIPSETLINLLNLEGDNTLDNCFSTVHNDLDVYNEYWWRRRINVDNGTYEKVETEKSDSQYIWDSNTTSCTVQYGDAIQLNSNGNISIVSSEVNTSTSVSNLQTFLNGCSNKYVLITKQLSNGTVTNFPCWLLYNPVEINRSGSNLWMTGRTEITSKYVPNIYIGPWEQIHSLERNTYPDNGIVNGYEYEYLGIPLENFIVPIKMSFGSYVGTGTYGESTPNILTFEFIPKLLFISVNDFSPGTGSINGGWYYQQGFIWTYGSTKVYARSSNTTDNLTVSLEGNTISWWSSQNRDNQFNSTVYTYRYFVIG